jgi:hypothetical protein
MSFTDDVHELHLKILGEPYQRCEEGLAGHVFKSTQAEHGIICTCGHYTNARQCVRCGCYNFHDTGMEYAHDIQSR